MRSNPFIIRTPEALDTNEIIALFENVFADIPSINQPGHTFIHGSRGSGKSMMFQYMLPKVQMEILSDIGIEKPNLNQLPFFCFYFPIRAEDFNILYSAPLNGSQRRVIYSHYLTMKLMEIVIKSLKEIFDEEIYKDILPKTDKFFQVFNSLIQDYGISDKNVVYGDFQGALEIIQGEQRGIAIYLTRLSMNGNQSYDRGISNFIDFVIPLLRNLKFMSLTQFYILIDDADELDIEMQKILNTWVFHRTTDIVSLKISTQLRYATYRTSSGSVIEAPHDFNSVDLTQIYTSKINHYLQRVERIVERRLRYYGFLASPYDFFPPDNKQEIGIKKEAQKITIEHSENGISSRPNDDVYRYAIPNYMTNLVKTKKSNKFSYSSFKTLVNISSGTIRYFLEPASKMYESLENSRQDSTEIDFIPSAMQNTILREWSESRYTEALPDLIISFNEEQEHVMRLKNLIQALGELFARKLLDESASERRVFSIFTDELPLDLEEIVSLGVSYGYLQRSSIRSKEKTGRKSEIIFSRTLAPYFYLDPTGYSGRLSVTRDALRQACIDPNKFVRDRLRLDKAMRNTTERLIDFD